MQHGNSPRPRGLLLEVQNWPPKKSSNYYWHRAIAASTAMSVTGVVPWSLSRPAIWSTKGMSIHSPNKALSCGGHNRLEWGRWDPRINMQTDWDSIMHVSSLFYWWMQLSPLWTQNVSHWPLYLQKNSNDQPSSPPQSQNITTQTMSYWKGSSDTLLLALLHLPGPRHVLSSPKLWSEDSLLCDSFTSKWLPFSLQIYRIEFKDSEKTW